jgi:hypothetical protein
MAGDGRDGRTHEAVSKASIGDDDDINRTNPRKKNPKEHNAPPNPESWARNMNDTTPTIPPTHENREK